ncbi:MAG: hypothetical protein ACXAEN_13405, partial [Candidatus Thorarchaeota archaeon]|jgi:hypothetical protein
MNTPTSLNLSSVYKQVGGKPTRAQFQKAINAWAGAIDGGKIRGVSKRAVQKSRMNPKARARKHTIRALQNPAPASRLMMMRGMSSRANQRSAMDNVKTVGIGVGGLYGTTYATNYISSLLSTRLKVSSLDKNAKYYAAEILPSISRVMALSASATTLLYFAGAWLQAL